MTKMLQVPEVSRKVTVLAVIVCLTWSTFTFQNVQALGQFVNPVCITSCDGRTDGQYLSCSRCDYYIMCSSGYLSAMPCPATTTYDGYLGVCVSRTIQGCSPTGQRLSPLEPGQSLQPTAGSPSLNEYPNQPYPGPTGSGQYPPTGPTYPIYRPPYYFPSTSKYFDPRFYYPISYPPYYNPSTQPSNPPTYPPSNPPTYPPTNPPTYPPTNPPTYPTYPPSNPPTYPPSNPPTYPPSNPPTYPTYPPSNPPTYPPSNPPTYPPSNPPTYPSSNPP
ncbi:spore coat protein SP85-like, partial [Physella acuta]|uniref:spore coat protein SP85-like n=1 Tax=Physella acuta TaxID=109671 RepID=UPI0027DD4B08